MHLSALATELGVVNRPSVQRRVSAVAGTRSVVACIILLGALLRLAHLAFIDMARPFRLGGLFAEFAQQIAANHYLLPSRVPFYTDGGIPFAYPPLPFYVEAVLLDVLSLPKFLVVNALPPLVSVLTLPSFYLLTRRLGLDSRARLLALLAYATLPAFLQHVEAAGLPEAFGSLALIWLAISLVTAHRRETLSSCCLVGLAWALCILASPGTAYASLPTMMMFAAIKLARAGWRPAAGTLGRLMIAGLIAAGLSGPYWATVIRNHGALFLVEGVRGQHGGFGEDIWHALLNFGIWQVGQVPFIWHVSIIWASLRALLQRNFALLGWFMVLSVIPREGVWMAAIPAAVLAGVGCSQLVDLLRTNLPGAPTGGPPRAVLAAGLLLLGTNMIVPPMISISRMVQEDKSAQVGDGKDRFRPRSSVSAYRAIQAAAEHTSAEGRFVVLANGNLKEWFPHLAHRTVLNTIYGSEWDPDEATMIRSLQRQVLNCRDVDCLLSAVRRNTGYDEVYLYVERPVLGELEAESKKLRDVRAEFQLLWRNEEIAVGRLRARS
jgi:hypothetical protein